MKSRLLQGVHRLTGRRNVEVDIVDNGEGMTEFQPEDDPLFERGTQGGFAIIESRSERNNPFAGWNAACVAPIIELIIDRMGHRAADIIAEQVSTGHVLSLEGIRHSLSEVPNVLIVGHCHYNRPTG